jgi:UDP-glucose 4-epimerase
VTGAGGFIGGTLVRKLQAGGEEVCAFVRRPEQAVELRELGMEVLVEDLADPINLEPTRPADVLVHLAAANDARSKDADVARRDTVDSVEGALERAEQWGIGRFVYFSTFRVHGDPTGRVDEDSLLSPVDEYGRTHLEAEQLVRTVDRAGGPRSLILRPTNVYGRPHSADVDRWWLVPGCFAKEAVEEGTITLRSSGLQLRDFVTLEQVSSWTITLLRRFDECAGRTLTLASGESTSIRAMAELVRERFEALTGRGCTLRVISDEPVAPPSLDVDPMALRTALGTLVLSADPALEVDRTLELLLERRGATAAGTPSD